VNASPPAVRTKDGYSTSERTEFAGYTNKNAATWGSRRLRRGFGCLHRSQAHHAAQARPARRRRGASWLGSAGRPDARGRRSTVRQRSHGRRTRSSDRSDRRSGYLHMLSLSVSTEAALPSSNFTGSSPGMTTVGMSDGGSAGAARSGRSTRGRAARTGRFAGRDGVARPARPRRWTLPITALRVTPPSCLAIWLADSPSAHSLRSSATRSSFQPMFKPLCPWPRISPGMRRHFAHFAKLSTNRSATNGDIPSLVLSPGYSQNHHWFFQGLIHRRRLDKSRTNGRLAPSVWLTSAQTR
jgi:hypothetical protein